MALRIDIRRFASLALALLIAVALVGPVCLMAASSAMAMPSPASNLCDSDPATMCPYERPDANVNVAQVPVYAVAIAWLPTPGAEAPTDLGNVFAPAVEWSETPVSHLTPLRV